MCIRDRRKTVTDRDIELFAEVSTDRNPVHLDEAYAQDTIFEGRIAHGMLTAGLISAVIGEQLPGHGTVYLGQSLKFMAPVRPGDTVEAVVKVTAIDHGRRRVTLETHCAVGNKMCIRDSGYTPEQVDSDFAEMEKALMSDRNQAWIPVIEAAAAKGPVFAGFGALHLSGEKGVLNLLAQDGYTITQLPLP